MDKHINKIKQLALKTHNKMLINFNEPEITIKDVEVKLIISDKDFKEHWNHLGNGQYSVCFRKVEYYKVMCKNTRYQAERCIYKDGKVNYNINYIDS